MTHPHPLDPLTADEIRRVTGLLRRERGVARPQWRIAAIERAVPFRGLVRPQPRDGTVRAAEHGGVDRAGADGKLREPGSMSATGSEAVDASADQEGPFVLVAGVGHDLREDGVEPLPCCAERGVPPDGGASGLGDHDASVGQQVGASLQERHRVKAVDLGFRLIRAFIGQIDDDDVVAAGDSPPRKAAPSV